MENTGNIGNKGQHGEYRQSIFLMLILGILRQFHNEANFYADFVKAIS